jgi:hypothetical protein
LSTVVGCAGTTDCDTVDSIVIFCDPHQLVDCRPEYIRLLLLLLPAASSLALQQHKRSQQTPTHTR